MNDYENKRAIPLTQYTYSEITRNLNHWRNIIRDELECLIYVKSNLQINQSNSSFQLNVSGSSLGAMNYQDKVNSPAPRNI